MVLRTDLNTITLPRLELKPFFCRVGTTPEFLAKYAKIVPQRIENEPSPLWQQIVEATKNGDGMTEKEKDGESGLVKLNILAVIYDALLSQLHAIICSQLPSD